MLTAVAVALVAPAALARQGGAGGTVSHPVVQPIPSSANRDLDAALARLGQNPRDVAALVDAGNAALAVGDVDASSGFFRRADQIAPNDPRVKAGWARALVRSGNPFDAIPLFDAAEKAGASGTDFLLDRGLAYDLVGDNATAQRLYRQALAAGPDDEGTRRLALSQAIAGDKRGAEATLTPLLQRQDKPAWRVRVFALAILGKPEEAVLIANSTLPAGLAQGIAPYLRYMPRLTPAQQAAAATFGNFPRASEIGHDDPRVAQFTRSQTPTAVAAADAGLVPSGEPLGRRDRSRRSGSDRRDNQAQPTDSRASVAVNTERRSRQREARVAPPELEPARETAPLASAATPARPRPLPAARAPVATRSAPPAPPVASAATPAGRPPVIAASGPTAPVAHQVGPAAPAPGFDLNNVSQAPAAAPPAQPAARAPAPTAVAPPAPAAAPAPHRPSLAEAFSDLSPPTIDAAPAAGAVDIRRIRPPRETAEPAKPPPPAHPSRIWVQVATGRDKHALAYDWRRMARTADTAMKGKQPFVSAWGQTNRLLTGPFASEAAANSFIAQMRREDINGLFVWTSPAGQVVDALPAR